MMKGRRLHTQPRERGRDGAGFTLLEVLVALFIFALLGGSVYMVIRSSSDAYSKGNASMEIYQSVRVGMHRMLTDLRRAVSPESIWNNQPESEEDMADRIDEITGLEEDVEPEPRDIMFYGTGDQVQFVTEDVMPRRETGGFDLREVVYRVDPEEKVLVKEIRDSVIRRRLNDLRAERTANETDYRAAHPEEFEWTGEPERIVIANNVIDMTLAYYDGKEWADVWNSEQIYQNEEYADLPEEEQPQGPEERYGLPDAVAVTLVLTNGDQISAITEIPARDMDLLLAINETEFARRGYQSTVAYNQREGVVPRGGLRDSLDRQRGADGLRIGAGRRTDSTRRSLRDRDSSVRRGSRSTRSTRSTRSSRSSRSSRTSSRSDRSRLQ